MEEHLRIKEAAERVGLNPKTIRYYEEVGLLPRFRRIGTGLGRNRYRLFTRQDLNRLTFVKRARQLGLSLAQVKELLTATEQGAPSTRLAAFVDEKLSEIDSRVRELSSLRRALRQLRQRLDEGPTAARSCCEPVCGPITCEPAKDGAVLVALTKRPRPERR